MNEGSAVHAAAIVTRGHHHGGISTHLSHADSHLYCGLRGCSEGDGRRQAKLASVHPSRCTAVHPNLRAKEPGLRPHPTPTPRPGNPRSHGTVSSHSQPEPAIRSLSLGMAWRTRLTTSRRSRLVRNGNSPVEPWTTKPATQPHQFIAPIPTVSKTSGC